MNYPFIGLILAFLIKLFIIYLLSLRLRKYVEDFLESIIAAWVLFYLLEILLLLSISAFHSLTTKCFWIGLFVILLCSLFINYKVNHSHGINTEVAKSEFISYTSPIAIAGISVIFIWLFVWSFYFYDTTGDAVSYEIPRILYFLQEETLFADAPVYAINLISNEWNGEINGIYYVLATGLDQASSFGNVENWIFACLSLAWVGEILGAPQRYRFFVALLIASTPCILGLTMTVKGDMLCIIGMAVSTGFLIQFYRKNIAAYYLFFMAAISLALGAKIIVAISAVFFIIMINWSFLREIRSKHRNIIYLILAVIFSASGLSRFIINIFLYGTPFKRVSGEINWDFSIIKLFHNLQILLLKVSEPIFDPLFPLWRNKKIFWSLAHGVGYLGFFVILAAICCAYLLLKREQNTIFSYFKRRNVNVSAYSYLIVFGLIAGCVFDMLIIPKVPWSFRYFAPWAFVLLLLIVSELLAFIESRSKRYFSIFLMAGYACVMFNVIVSSSIGESRPTSFKIAAERSDLQRKGAFHQFWFQAFDNFHVLSHVYPKQVLIVDNVAGPIVPYFGNNREMKVQFVNSKDLFMKRYKEFGLIVFAGNPSSFEDDVTNTLLNDYYNIYNNNVTFNRVFFKIGKNLESGTFLEFKGLREEWMLWGAKENTILDLEKSTIISSELGEAGFITKKPYRFDHGLYAFDLKVEGKVVGLNNSAGCLGFLGYRKIINIPSGDYNNGEIFRGMIYLEDYYSGHLVFCLGGWSKGKGALRLVDLNIKHIRPIRGVKKPW